MKNSNKTKLPQIKSQRGKITPKRRNIISKNNSGTFSNRLDLQVENLWKENSNLSIESMSRKKEEEVI